MLEAIHAGGITAIGPSGLNSEKPRRSGVVATRRVVVGLVDWHIAAQQRPVDAAGLPGISTACLSQPGAKRWCESSCRV
jgi:hypothetical protein